MSPLDRAVLTLQGMDQRRFQESMLHNELKDRGLTVTLCPECRMYVRVNGAEDRCQCCGYPKDRM